MADLLKRADAVRKKQVGDAVHLRALIEISNICNRDCLYCGIRRSNTKIKRYKLSARQIIATAKKAKKLGFKTVVLQSGESKAYSLQELLYIIREIKKLGLIVTLSLGEKTKKEYAAYRAAGADRYLLRVETTNPKLYKKLHPGASLATRKRCLNNLKKLGFETGTGILIGLPSQTEEMIAQDIKFLKTFKPEMVGLGPFIPAENTPLAKCEGGTLDMALQALAAARLAVPAANIPATTALEALAPGARKRALSSGANVVMPNLTPAVARQKYRLYPNKPATTLAQIKKEIRSLGRKTI